MADVLKTLAVKITGDDKGAVAALDRTALAAEKTAAAQAKLEVQEAKLAVANAKLAGDTDALAAAQERLVVAQKESQVASAQLGVAQAERQLQGLTQQAAASGAAAKVAGLSGTAIATGAAAATAALVKEAESFAKFGDEVRQFRDISGTSTEEASRFVATFQGLGIDLTTADTAVGRLAKNIGNNNDVMAKWGVTVARNKDGTVNLGQTLVNVGDRYSSLSDTTDKAALASAAFGRGYTQFIPVLRAGTTALKEFGDEAAKRGEILSPADIKKAEEFKVAVQELKDSLDALGRSAGKNAAQDLANLANAFAVILNPVAKLVSVVARARDDVEGFFGRIAKHIPGVVELGRALGLGSEAARRLADSGTDAAGALDLIEQSTKAADTALTDLISASDSYESSVNAVTSAEKTLATAKDEVTKKAQDETKAAADSKKATDDLTTAQDKLSKAQRDVALNLALANDEATKSADDLADKTDAVAVAMEKHGAASHQAKSAQDDLTLAQDKATEAQRKADDLKAQGDRPDAVVQAEQAIASAKERQASAAAEQTKADAIDPVADIAKAEKELEVAKQRQLLAQYTLNEKLTAYNKEFGTTLTFADELNGKLGEIIAKQVTLQNNQAAINAATANQTGAGLTSAQDAAGRASVLQGPLTNPKLATGGLTPAQQTIINNYISMPTADPNAVANAIDRKIASSGRARVQ